ncbi:Speckle-type POZ protein [Araneus ventricosus]|uniref:Speckle-type POZ protein n=1 Tax=Araneus ventricosus TaxID=182803 RepID=A0A4Y2TXD9_ARAVE|nr:Speckle-type POZ protein [Araneus ventricosus]
MGQAMSSSDTPVLPTYASKTRYVFTWTIHSLSWTAQNFGICVDSPHFLTADGGVWTIRLYPFGVNYFCSLLRMHDRAPLVLYYDVDFLPKIGDGPPSYSMKAEPFSIGHLLHIPHEIVSLDSATRDFLILQFRLKKCRRKGPRGVLIVSEIQVERSSSEYSCSFKEAMKTSLMVDNEAQDIIENERNFVSGKYFHLEENREEEVSQEIFPMKMQCCGLGYAVVALNRSRTKHYGQSRIHLLDIKGRIHASSEVGEHFFRNDLMDLFRYHNLMTAEQMGTDEKILSREGQLDFIFEIETSNGKFSFENCERIYNVSRSRNHNSLKHDMKGFFHVLKKTDFQSRIGEEAFLAHWPIVSARSPVFHTMLKSDMLEKETGVVDVEGIDSKTFRRLMCFIYTATFDRDMDCEDIANLYAAADRYSVVSLKRICSSILKSYISVDNWCYLLIFSELHQDDELKHVVEFFIFTHYEDIIHSCDWKIMEENYSQMAEDVLEKHLQWNKKFYLNEDKIMAESYKYCIVPKCRNTTVTAPDKLFINVPKNYVIRKKWCKAMKRDPKLNPELSASSVPHVCGDHFDVSY